MEEIIKLNDKLSRVYDAVRDVSFYQSNLDRCVKELSRVKDGIYLDAGCGTGNLFSYLANLVDHSTVIGVDISREMLKRARDKIKNTGLDAYLIRADIAHLPFKEDTLDGIISINVLHELPDPQSFIKEAARVIKPERNFVVSALEEKSFKNCVIPFVKDSIRNPRLLLYLPRFIFYFVMDKKIKKAPITYSYTKDELLDSLCKEGFQVDKIGTTYLRRGWLIVGRKMKKA